MKEGKRKSSGYRFRSGTSRDMGEEPCTSMHIGLEESVDKLMHFNRAAAVFPRDIREAIVHPWDPHQNR